MTTPIRFEMVRIVDPKEGMAPYALFRFDPIEMKRADVVMEWHEEPSEQEIANACAANLNPE